MSSVIHVTHEAVHKIGGIGAVLNGLITAAIYQQQIERTILLGPLFSPADEEQIAADGEVMYSSFSGVQQENVAESLQQIERQWGVRLVYGVRTIADTSTRATATVEVLLIDVGQMDIERENHFKFILYEKFGLQSERYESSWDYIQYLRLAEPGYAALNVLLAGSEGPHFVVSHEYMGMPLALKAMVAADARFRTIFYAHEVSTIRPLVEQSPGHDAMFYNVMARAMEEGLSVTEVFGDQSGFYRHALVEQAHLCDGIFAVGDWVMRELRFLGPAFKAAPIELVYNGIPTFEISLEEKKASVELLQRYGEALLGWRPDAIFTHVTRLVTSKGLWRDLQVLEHVDKAFVAAGKRGVLFILSTAGGTRNLEDVERMEADYGWPVGHRIGYPDLEGPEVGLWELVDVYNQRAQATQVVFVNQFGWDRAHCGSRMPAAMNFMDLRQGSHAEFGQSIYEPFGIAQVEPLSFGALCVVSNVCGCCGFVERAAGAAAFPNLIVADYTALTATRPLEELLRLESVERLQLEQRQSAEVAGKILEHLPQTDQEMRQALERGYRVAQNMSWERVCQDLFLPGLERAAQRPR